MAYTIKINVDKRIIDSFKKQGMCAVKMLLEGINLEAFKREIPCLQGVHYTSLGVITLVTGDNHLKAFIELIDENKGLKIESIQAI